MTRKSKVDKMQIPDEGTAMKGVTYIGNVDLFHWRRRGKGSEAGVRSQGPKARRKTLVFSCKSRKAIFHSYILAKMSRGNGPNE